tara:strand:- start:167 stop:535 length:369 start_codon:yes stop_codon:yes gene_type:complete
MFSDILDKEEDRMNLIREMLKTLTKREENVLRLYFGIDGKRSSLEEIGMDYDLTVNTIRKVKNKGVLKMIHRVTKYEPFIFYFSSDVDKDLLKRCIDERKSKLFDEFMVKLLKIDWEEWVLK